MARRTGLARVLASAVEAAQGLARTTGRQRVAALHAMAGAIERRAAEIVRDNHDDMSQAKRARAGARELDLLLLDDDRIRVMANRMRAVAALSDPIGGGIDTALPNGLRLTRRRVPLGVVGVVCEAAPHVTTDAAAVCLRGGNAVVLRGGEAAHRTNRILTEVLEGALAEAGVPRASIRLVGPAEDELAGLLGARGLLDLLVVRGEPREARRLAEAATVPVVLAPSGLAHVYVDSAADPGMTGRIVTDLGTPRPREQTMGEALLVHRDASRLIAPEVLASLAAHGVPARVVDGMDEALAVIAAEGTGQLAAVISGSTVAAERFVRDANCACVVVNASPRLVEDAQLGGAADLGIAIGPGGIHGPLRADRLTTLRHVAVGDGQIS